MKRKIHKQAWLGFILIVIVCFPLISAGENENYTSMVYPDPEGRLVYAPDEAGNIIPDYSNAGYMGGGVALPYVPVKETVYTVEGDAAPIIQAAIDKVSAMPIDKYGFRGTVLIKKGYYELFGPVLVAKSGVVLRGEGDGDTGTVLIAKTLPEMKTAKNGLQVMVNSKLIQIAGEQGIEEDPKTAQEIIDLVVPLGTRSFRVKSAKGFKAGDTVIVRRRNNAQFLKDLMVYNEKRDADGVDWTHDFDRVICSVKGNIITVDAPITCPIEKKYGGGEVIKYTDHRISHVGVEKMRGVSEFDKTKRDNSYGWMLYDNYEGEEYYSDENHYGIFISIDNAINAWVRDCSMLHFGLSLVRVGTTTKWVTVQDCDTCEPVSITTGSRRISFGLNGQLALVQRCTSDKGRHSFAIHGNLTPGPNVFLDCTATRIYGSSEPHSLLIVGALYDNVQASIALRYAESNPPRWLTLWGVLWNCEGTYLCQHPPIAENYAFGHKGFHVGIFNFSRLDYSFGNGHIEFWDEHVSPRSLYLKQLEDRLGKEAVMNISK